MQTRIGLPAGLLMQWLDRLMDLNSLRQQGQKTLQTFLAYKWVFLGCVTFCTLGGVVFALMTPKVYQASQPFLVRDEISGKIMKPGRFDSLEAMKSAQETIQEIAKNPEVLRSALSQAGPTSWFADPADFPDDSTVEGFRDDVWISAANGAELGKTEVIHLNVRAHSRERAQQLVELVTVGMAKQLRDVRGRRATSIESELKAAVNIATTRLEETTERVVAMERGLGEDLMELRAMESPHSGESSLRPALIKVDDELLGARNLMQQADHQVVFFAEAMANPDHLLGVPNELLEQHQTLKELKLGLVRARLSLSTASGRFVETSSQVRQIQNEIDAIQRQIYLELDVAIQCANVQKQFAQTRMQTLNQQREKIQDRLRNLADQRAPYANLMEELRVASDQYREAKTELSQAQAVLSGTEKVDLMTRLEKPHVGTQPVSLSRSTVVMGSLGCGVFIALGLVMLLSAPGNEVSPRELDRLIRERELSQR